MGRGWKNLEVHARKSHHCHEQIVKDDCGEGSERKMDSCRGILSLLREYLNNPKQSFGRNADSKGHSDKVSGGNEEHIIGSWRKGHFCDKVKNLTELCSCSSVL